MGTEAGVPKRRVQFSLGTLAMGVVAAGAFMGWWFSQRKVEGLEKSAAEQGERVSGLEDELGLMRAEGYGFEEDAVLSKSVPVPGEHTRAWTIYFAKDRTVDVFVDLKNIGGVAGTNSTSVPLELKKGLYRMQAEFQRGEGGKTVLLLTLPSHAKTAPVLEIKVASTPAETDWIFYASEKRLSGGRNYYLRGTVGMLDLGGVGPAGGPHPGISMGLKLLPAAVMAPVAPAPVSTGGAGK